jgi:hypothetical protein
MEEQLTESVREALVGAGAVREVKMFGGIGAREGAGCSLEQPASF